MFPNKLQKENISYTDKTLSIGNIPYEANQTDIEASIRELVSDIRGQCQKHDNFIVRCSKGGNKSDLYKKIVKGFAFVEFDLSKVCSSCVGQMSQC